MNQRFTIDGSDSLEATLTAICAQASEGVRQILPKEKVIALVLGGGYGRGEGGVLRTPQGDQPYNDLEFYVLLRGANLFRHRRITDAIHHMAEELSQKAGVEVEFKLLPLRKLERSSVTMFYYDLVSGHRVIEGNEAWLARCDHHRAAHRIPLYEATRLLMNRCSGLLYAQERLARSEFNAEDADFVGRNLAKARLALGDVLLTMRGQYHWSCQERQKRLRQLGLEDGKRTGLLASLAELHAQGVQFKLHPVRTDQPKEALQSELNTLKSIARQLWLDLEGQRLGKSFPSVERYCADRASKCPESNQIKNRLINLRTFGMRGLLNGRYPRESLFLALAVLLWERDFTTRRALLTAALKTSAPDFPGWVRAYEKLWRIYN